MPLSPDQQLAIAAQIAQRRQRKAEASSYEDFLRLREEFGFKHGWALVYWRVRQFAPRARSKLVDYDRRRPTAHPDGGAVLLSFRSRTKP
jgi:hypothetical protein